MLLGLTTFLLLATGAPSTAETAQKPEEKKICRKQIETGSLIKGKKLCYTARQWQQISDANRADLESRASSGSQSGQ